MYKPVYLADGPLYYPISSVLIHLVVYFNKSPFSTCCSLYQFWRKIQKSMGISL
jgi:hypothetical protein